MGRRGFADHWHRAEEQSALFDAFEKRVLSTIAKYQIPVITLKQNTPKVAVCQNLPLDGYLAWRDVATQGFLKAAKLLRLQHVYSARDLPYQTQLVPLAAALARLGTKADNDGVRKKLARWLWSGVFGELYGGAVESRFAFDVPDLLALAAGGPEPRTVSEALFDPRRLLTLRSRLSAAYKGLHAILMRDGGLDFLSGQPITFTTFSDERIDIHHIFPKKWCEDEGIPRARYDCVVNKTALSARTNRIIGKKAPSVYLGQLQKEAGMSKAEMDRVLRTHVADPVSLRADDFDAFFAARESALLERIAGAMGKPVAAGGASEPFAEAADQDDEIEPASESELDAAAA